MHRPQADRLDPRAARSRRSAIDAALALIRELGAGRTTMEAIAARSGVAKTTLYRQFGDLETLLFAAFESLTAPPAIPVEAGVVADVRSWLHQFAEVLTTDEFAPWVPAMIDVAERNEHGHALAVDFAARRRLPLRTRLSVAIDAGELAVDTDVDTLVSMLVGPLFYRRFVSRQATSFAFVDHVVDSALGSLVASPA